MLLLETKQIYFNLRISFKFCYFKRIRCKSLKTFLNVLKMRHSPTIFNVSLY